MFDLVNHDGQRIRCIFVYVKITDRMKIKMFINDNRRFFDFIETFQGKIQMSDENESDTKKLILLLLEQDR